MPLRSPRICSCGLTIASGQRCPCARKRDAKRPSARQRGYDAQWEKARAAFLCEPVNRKCRACGAPASHVDHIIPHRGDRALFNNRSNWQSLCGRCHSRKTAREDGGFGHAIKERGALQTFAAGPSDRRGQQRRVAPNSARGDFRL